MPVSLLTAALGIPVFDGVTFREDRNELCQKIIAAALAAATVGCFYLTARRLLSRPLALGLAAWLAAGMLVSSTSRALWSDSFALPLSFAGLYIFTRAVVPGRPMRHWTIWLAAALSLAFMMKPLYAIPSAMLGLLVVLDPSIPLRLKASFVATCAIGAALFSATSFLIYGGLLPPYFTPSRVEYFEPSHLASVLFSPGRGLLWFTPSALLLCGAPFLVWRDRRLFAAGVMAAAAVVTAILTLSKYNAWWGGYAYGPRLFQFALPAVALLALIMAYAAGRLGRRAQLSILSLFAVVAAWEAFVHVSGVISPLGWTWNVTPVTVDEAPQRLWDWSDPQFLAAFSKRGPAADNSQ